MKITPSQAMLVLFDKYLKVRKNLSEQLEKAGEVDWDELETDIYENEVKIAELKELYISGAQTAEQKTQLDKWMRDDALNAYEISYDYNFINNDPSRRYFESHLSLETIKLHLADLSATDLEKHRDFILNYSRLDTYKQEQLAALGGRFDKEKYTSKYIKEKAEQSGGVASSPDFGPAEFADAISAIRTLHVYSDFSAEDKEKLVYIMQFCYFAVINVAKFNHILPFRDITRSAPYDSKSRGRYLKTDTDLTELDALSHVSGLMKSYMPIARNDILYREEGYKFLKPSDRCYFDKDAAFIKTIFESALNTFSCSISGTTLCQIKMLAQAAIEHKLRFNSCDKLKDFFRIFIASIQFHSGGHTMIEFCSVLALPEIRRFFTRVVPGFDAINVSELFLHGNKIAFDTAIERSIDFNNTLMHRNALHEQIREDFSKELAKEPIEGVIHMDHAKEVVKTMKEKLQELTPDKSDSTHNEKDSEGGDFKV